MEYFDILQWKTLFKQPTDSVIFMEKVSKHQPLEKYEEKESIGWTLLIPPVGASVETLFKAHS